MCENEECGSGNGNSAPAAALEKGVSNFTAHCGGQYVVGSHRTLSECGIKSR